MVILVSPVGRNKALSPCESRGGLPNVFMVIRVAPVGSRNFCLSTCRGGLLIPIFGFWSVGRLLSTETRHYLCVSLLVVS